MPNKQPWRSVKNWFTFRPWQRHSLVVMVGGLAYIGLGVSLITAGELSARRESVHIIALNIMPMSGWGWLFVFAGILACMSSRWPGFSETWGYSVLLSNGAAWSAIYLLGYLFGGSPHSNITYGIVWALVSFMWWAISGLVNPDRVARTVVSHVPH